MEKNSCQKIEEMVNIIYSGNKLYLKDFYPKKIDFIVDSFNEDINEYLKTHQKTEQLDILLRVVQCILSNDATHIFYINDTLDCYAPNYALTFQEVLRIFNSDEKRALNLLKNIKNKHVLESFKKRYVNSEIYIPTLVELFSKIPVEKEKQVTYVNMKALNNHDYISFVEEIYESNLSPLDFYFYNSVNISQYNVALAYCKKNELVKIINKRENHTLPLLKKIIECLGNEDFDIISYYKLTKINIGNLKPLARKYNIDISRNASIKISNYTNNTKFNIDNEVEGTLIINGVEIPRKIKQEAIDYIQNNDIPLNVKTYDTMVRKLIKK